MSNDNYLPPNMLHQTIKESVCPPKFIKFEESIPKVDRLGKRLTGESTGKRTMWILVSQIQQARVDVMDATGESGLRIKIIGEDRWHSLFGEDCDNAVSVLNFACVCKIEGTQ